MKSELNQFDQVEQIKNFKGFKSKDKDKQLGKIAPVPIQTKTDKPKKKRKYQHTSVYDNKIRERFLKVRKAKAISASQLYILSFVEYADKHGY